MNLSNLAFKFNSLITNGTFMYHSSSIGANGDVVNTVEATSFSSGILDMIVSGLINIVLKVIYTICAFLLNLIELFQFVVCQILGISVDLDDYVVLDKNNPLVKMLTNEEVIAVFKIIFGVAIVLIIVFTIFAIIKAEYKYATTGNEKTTSKGRIMMRSLRSFFTLGMFPLMIIFAVILINALLAGFNDVLRGGEDDVTLAGQIFTTSAYNGNNYRRYANQDIRVPIIINFEDPIYLGQEEGYSTEELAKIYEHYGPKGAELYTSLAELDFGGFNDSVIYRNNALYNASSFNGFEQFVCTREQYYVMADFIDYAVKHNLRYYVKAMDDVDVSWKYVSNTIYDKDTQSLKITYKDASNLSGKAEYTVVYQPSQGDVSTPISDAVKTISALLSIGEYGDITFNALNRLEDSINIVEWGTDKAYLKLSSSYSTNPTSTDKLLLYERARYKYNNSLNYTISDLVEGVELPVYRLDKRVFQGSTLSYVVYETHYVVLINGTYYEVEYNEELKDSSGNLILDSYNDHYYTLLESDFDDFTVTHSASDDAVNIYGSSSNTYWIINEGAYKDIIITKSNGTFENELEDGYILYTEYDDQLSPVLKQISWSEKLIRDLQVIYKDININHMMTTDKWLTQLGEYVSADDTEGDYTSNISTALIHPLGLILAELFLGEIEESDDFNLYGSLMFDGKFDDETMKALMLSLLGENRYFAMKAEFEYFNEIFNVFMGPILDEIAYYENFELMNGQEASVQLYTYKAYLCSVLISSSAAKWLGQTALELIGYTGLENEIIITSGAKKGYYKKYSQLSYSFQMQVLELYLENINILKDQYVEEGDRAYPEYMTALKNYMGYYPIEEGLLDSTLKQKYDIDEETQAKYFLADDEEQFDGRLDVVLTSYLMDDYQLEIVNEKHDALVVAYDNLYNYIFSSYSNDDAATIWMFVGYEIEEAKADGNDAFTYATMEGTLNALVDKIPTSREKIKKYLDSNYSSYSADNAVFLNTFLDPYYECVREYVDEKLDYIIPDQSHKFNGMLDDLENDKFWALMQSETVYNTLGTNSNKSILSSLGISYDSLIDPKDNFFGLIKGDVEGKNDIAGWNDLVDKFNKLKNKIDSVNYDYHPVIKGLLSIYISGLERYIETQNTMDRLNRYYITYGVSAIMKQRADISLEVVLNSKHYTVGQNFTRAKFVEYVLGNQVRSLMNDANFGLVFVDDSYEGLVKINTTPGVAQTYNSFENMQDFLVELGDITAVLSQMTNLVNVSAGSIDEVVIGAKTTTQTDLSGLILRTIIEQEFLPIDIVRAFFDVSSSVIDSKVNEVALSNVMQNINYHKYETNNELLNTVMSYLLLTDLSEERPTFIDYSKLTLKEMRTKCLQALIDYEEQKGETAEQNQKRYLTIFALACGDWSKSGVGAKNNSWYIEDRNSITSFVINKQSQATILRLAGLENRPYQELVGAEYTIDFETKGVDEANGDVFVICTFDEETKMYIPFMMTNKEHADGDGLPVVEDETWCSKVEHWNPYTEYYVTEGGNEEIAYFPVIAKGVIDHNGMPTAIRENEGNIEYYRDGIVIHDVGKYGLSEYFVSVDQIPVNHTAISYVANMFSSLFTGKTLVEKLVESNPRFAANSDFKFLYGKERTITEVSIDGYTAISFNFDESVCIDMEYLYTLEHMNIVVLIIAVASIVMALWKAVWGVTQRMFDITIYFLLGPAVISVIPLRQDKLDKKKNVEESNDDAYAKWKDTLIERLLAVFAYAIGFNIFFIIIPIVTNLTLFESATMFEHLPLFNKLSVGFLNELARMVFIVASAYLTTRAPALFAKITKTGNGFKDGDMALGNVKSVVNEVKDHWSGQYAMDKIGSAKDKFVSVIPGVALGKEIHGKVQQASNAIVSKGAEMYLKAHGVPPDVAKKMGTALKDNMKQRQNEDKYYKETKKLERAAREAERNGDEKAGKISDKADKMRKNLESNRKDHKETVKKYKP
ncbi:MAG: hypothetical protein IKC11_01250 [Clostridia bacterium]|nr:hypothetical protein [Clostridia bacterium]